MELVVVFTAIYLHAALLSVAWTLVSSLGRKCILELTINTVGSILNNSSILWSD